MVFKLWPLKLKDQLCPAVAEIVPRISVYHPNMCCLSLQPTPQLDWSIKPFPTQPTAPTPGTVAPIGLRCAARTYRASQVSPPVMLL
jgi:hypothetical protein